MSKSKIDIPGKWYRDWPGIPVSSIFDFLIVIRAFN